MNAPDRPVLDEIEVTPAMLSAGIEAACLFDPTQDDFEVMLPHIFRQMALAALEPHRAQR